MRGMPGLRSRAARLIGAGIAIAVAATGTVVTAPVVAAPAVAASGAPVARVLVELADPLATDPVEVQVAALGADGFPVPFTGSLTLSVGRTKSVGSTAGDGIDIVDIDTHTLSGGLATLTAVIRGATGKAVTARRTQFVEVVSSLAVAGFGCAAVGPSGAPIRFGVTRMAGEYIRTPNSRTVPLLPYVAPSGRRSLMIDDDWLPMRTSGAITVLSGTKAVATLRLPKQVRRLVFGATWNGRVRGRFTPGVYTARLTLVDAVGRTVTAVTPVTVVRSGTLPCGQ